MSTPGPMRSLSSFPLPEKKKTKADTTTSIPATQTAALMVKAPGAMLVHLGVPKPGQPVPSKATPLSKGSTGPVAILQETQLKIQKQEGSVEKETGDAKQDTQDCKNLFDADARNTSSVLCQQT